jgi:predicted transcriptional regulator
MKNKILNIVFESWSDFKSRTKKELREIGSGKATHTQPQDIMVFDSVASYQRLMSEQKYMILAAIRNLKPTSIYQLAKLVERDFANVKKDCDTMEASGFIVLEDSGDNRGTRIPKLIFDYNVIEIHMPNMTYSHNLGKTAA